MWRWARQNSIAPDGREVPGGIDAGESLQKVKDNINQKFYFGQAKDSWLNDIITGRKTPLRAVTNDMWKKAYNRRVTVQQAEDMSRRASMGTFSKVMDTLWTVPRSVAVFGHSLVFPITHGGDLAFRPASWGTLIKGMLQTYMGSYNKGFAERVLQDMEGDKMYDMGLRSGVKMGEQNPATGILSKWFHGPSERAWKMLSAMRFNLWKGQMMKYITPDMPESEQLAYGKQFAEWANNATGAGKGPVADLGQKVLFGPMLTQSKLNRLFTDPIQTIKTFGEWSTATPAEKAVAWTRLSGAAQFAATNLGFLAVNQGLLYALGSSDKINVTDPTKSDYFSMKGDGLVGDVPGLHTEIRTLGKILATAFMSRKDLHGDTRFAAVAKVGGQYAVGKLMPTIQRGLEVGLAQNWMGRPLPWSSELGTPKAPRMTWGEYAGSIGPLPLDGPIGFVYDKLRAGGASALDATAIVKGLIISGLGLPGFRVREYKPPPEVAGTRRSLTDREMSNSEARRR
jgi:hypothetical protein